MSKIMAEQLLAGIILGDAENKEFIYLPGGEVGSENPYCVFEKDGVRKEDLPFGRAICHSTLQEHSLQDEHFTLLLVCNT